MVSAVALLIGTADFASAQSNYATPHTFATLAGAPGGATDAKGSLARFQNPVGITADKSGNLYVTDTDNHTIRKISSDGTVTTLAGRAGTPGTSDGLGTNALFNAPEGIAVDGTGTVYVSDTGNQTIRKVSSSGAVTTLAGTAGTRGSANGTGTSASFSSPAGLALDASGNLYVADRTNGTLRKITPGGVVTTIAGVAGQSVDPGQTSSKLLNTPASVAVEGSGSFIVTDARGVHRVAPDGTITDIATNTSLSDYASAVAISSTGTIYCTGIFGGFVFRLSDSGAASVVASAVEWPRGLTLDPQGNLFVTSTNAIQKIATDRTVTVFAGTPSVGTADGSLTDARFNTPMGVVVDKGGNVYVADANNHSIRKISNDGFVTTFSGVSGNSGYVDGPANIARFGSPSAIALDASGNVYVDDSTVIRRVRPDGSATTLAGNASKNGYRDGPGTQALFAQSQGIAVDTLGNVYVGDTGNYVIRKIDTAGTVTTIAGAAGQSGTQDGSDLNARFAAPTRLAITNDGTLYVVDGAANALRKISPSGVVSTIVGPNTQSGLVDGPTSTARLGGPSGIAIDAAGNIYFSEYGNQLIRKISPTGTVTTLAGFARTAGSADGTGSTARFNNPAGIAVDGAGNLFVADSSNNAIRVSATSAPVITSMPQSQAISLGTSLSLTVGLSTGGNTVQWQRNGKDIPGANRATYNVFSASAADSGTYTAVVTNSAGSVTTVPAIVSVSLSNFPSGGVPAGTSKLTNISTRSMVGTGGNVQIAGFIVSGSTPKIVLIRANGPTLAKYGVTGVLADPVIELHSTEASAPVIATNDNWGDDPSEKSQILSAMVATKAPAWDDGSKDAALVVSLKPGGYTALVSGKNGTTGIALIEVFEVDVSTPDSRLVNISTRSLVGTDAQVQIAGFIISGSVPKKVVIRASGPALTKYGVPGVLQDPKIELHDASTILATNDNWDASIRPDFQKVGLDNWDLGSKDAALVATLPPGGYTVIVSGAAQTSGVALIEVLEEQ